DQVEASLAPSLFRALAAIRRASIFARTTLLTDVTRPPRAAAGAPFNSGRAVVNADDRYPNRVGRILATLAARNKCLAQSNKSRTGGNATKAVNPSVGS